MRISVSSGWYAEEWKCSWLVLMNVKYTNLLVYVLVRSLFTLNSLNLLGAPP